MPPSRNASSLPLPASPFKFNNGDQTLTQSDSQFSLLNYFYLISTCGNLHAMTSAPPFLSPPSPCFLDVTASRSCACWILPAPTHQLSTSPLPAGVSSAFLRDQLGPGHAGSRLSHDMLHPPRPSHGCLRLGCTCRETSAPPSGLSS